MTETGDKTEMFKALAHPLRQQILLILAERAIGFTELQQELTLRTSKNVQVGSIYHHLSLLGDLIISENGIWQISNQGQLAVNLLTSESPQQFLDEKNVDSTPFLSIILGIFAPPEIFFFARKSFLLFLGWQILFMLTFAWLTAQAKLMLFAVFFVGGFNLSQDFLLSFGSVVISWIFFAFLTFLLAKYYLKTKRITVSDFLAFLIISGFALLPLAAFPIIIMFGIITFELPIIPLALVIILQLWVILLTARGISVNFIVRMERAGIVALIAVYVMIALALPWIF